MYLNSEKSIKLGLELYEKYGSWDGVREAFRNPPAREAAEVEKREAASR